MTWSGLLLSLQAYTPVSNHRRAHAEITDWNKKVDGVFNYDLRNFARRLIQDEGKMILSHTSYERMTAE